MKVRTLARVRMGMSKPHSFENGFNTKKNIREQIIYGDLQQEKHEQSNRSQRHADIRGHKEVYQKEI